MRYKFQPENTNHYTIITKAYWWQKKQTILLAIIVLSLLVVFIVFQQQQKRKLAELSKKDLENKQTKLELKAVYAQLNPHFIFNALSSIQGLINKNQIDEANKYLTEFSTLLRSALKNTDKELVPMSVEIQIMETYLNLEQLRFLFQYKIVVPDNINTNALELPPLLLQPIIENAIKHGVSAMNEKGTIDIEFSKKESDLIISIEDNGTGFDTDNIRSVGVGLKLTKERIQLFNQNSTEQIIFLTIESNFGNGTTVFLIFKNWL